MVDFLLLDLAKDAGSVLCRILLPAGDPGWVDPVIGKQ